MIFLKLILKIFLAFLIVWFLYKDSKRIFRAFFIHLERKILVVHSLKLGIFIVLIYKFNRIVPFHQAIIIFTSILLLLFLSLLTLKHVEFKLRGTINSKYKTFKYGSRLAQYLLYLLSILMNLGELRAYKHEIKEKSKEAMYVAVFPVQKYLMVSITGVELTRRKKKFITEAQLEEIRNELEPGDILLKRNDWQATNLGISGFWTHTGLYIGSINKLDEYFHDLPELEGRRFSEKLREMNEENYETLLKNSDLSVIEAIEEGVAVKSLSNIAKVDYFSSVRPRVSKEEKMKALLRAYSFVGRPYDYFIDMESKDAFICTKVIYKSFEDSVSFELEKKMGKLVVLPNSVVMKFAHERYKENKQLDFVLFYDLDLKTRKAFRSTETEFAESYKRSLASYRKNDMFRYLTTILDYK